MMDDTWIPSLILCVYMVIEIVNTIECKLASFSMFVGKYVLLNL
jgi:hypothetical protein